MAVDEDDLVRLAACLDLAGVTHADHVLCEFRLSFRAALALRDHERLESFLLQATQDLDGRDVITVLKVNRSLKVSFQRFSAT